MIIEKTFKLTIKDQTFFLSEEEVSNLYQQCRYALNIKDVASTPPSNPVTPGLPWPYDNHPWYTPKNPPGTGYPTWTTPNTTCNTIPKTIPSSDDMESIRENDKWRSSVQQALDKLSVKKNGTTTTNDMIWDHTHPKVDHNNGSLKFGT